MSTFEKSGILIAIFAALFLFLSKKKTVVSASASGDSITVPWFLTYNVPFYSGFAGAPSPIPSNIAGYENAPSYNGCDTCSVFPTGNIGTAQ